VSGVVSAIFVQEVGKTIVDNLELKERLKESKLSVLYGRDGELINFLETLFKDRRKFDLFQLGGPCRPMATPKAEVAAYSVRDFKQFTNSIAEISRHKRTVIIDSFSLLQIILEKYYRKTGVFSTYNASILCLLEQIGLLLKNGRNVILLTGVIEGRKLFKKTVGPIAPVKLLDKSTLVARFDKGTITIEKLARGIGDSTEV